MTLTVKRNIITLLAMVFLASLLMVQYLEVARKQEEAGLRAHHIAVPDSSKNCVDCHKNVSPGIIDHWTGSKHALSGVSCVECHQAASDEVDAFEHYGATIAAIVTPMDCAKCHQDVYEEFSASHHAKGGNILASLDNLLAETVEGARVPFNPHAATPGRPDFDSKMVDGMTFAAVGCKQCHGSKVGLQTKDGGIVTVEELKPDASGKPTNLAILASIAKDKDGRPLLDPSTWPNTGIGRINLDGSLGSCSACHSRHDFSPRRARQPENCGKCHLGPDHPQKEIFDESKHGIAYYDLKDHMNLDADSWILGKDYSQAPTCATCHMSANIRGGKITHDPGQRISWTNRPPVSLAMDTDAEHKIVTETDPDKRREQITDTWEQKRNRMKQVCSTCHTTAYVNNFYVQYDNFIQTYNEKYGKPGTSIMKALKDNGLLTKADFDETVEWTWYYLWHHEGRRARHGASMMAPDYAHWHGTFEVAERWYTEFIPEVRHLIEDARKAGKVAEANACSQVVEEIMNRPEHKWQANPDGFGAKAPEFPIQTASAAGN